MIHCDIPKDTPTKFRGTPWWKLPNREDIAVVTRKEHMAVDGRINKRDAYGRFKGGI